MLAGYLRLLVGQVWTRGAKNLIEFFRRPTTNKMEEETRGDLLLKWMRNANALYLGEFTKIELKY